MKTMIQAAAVTLFAASAAHAQQPVQWRVQDGGNGHWYGVTPQRGTWQQDRDFAKSMGGDLATITSESESVFLCSGLMDTGPWATEACWMGMRLSSAGAFEWVSGEPVAWTNWYPSGPHSPPYQVVWVTGPRNPGGSNPCWWNDADPNPSIGHIYFGLVEWSADCNNDGIVDYGQCRDGSLPDYNANNIPDCCESGTACVVGNYPVQWRVQDGGNGHWYQALINPAPFAWQRDLADNQGAEVVCIADAGENAFVFRFARSLGIPSIWIGLAQAPLADEPGDGWQWVDGSSSSWRYWGSGEPNNWQYDEDNCKMVVSEVPDGDYWASRWQDYPAFWNIAAVIEWSADCNNDGIVDYGQILEGNLADANSNNVPDRCECGAFPTLPSCCLGDLNADRSVDGADLGALLFAWGPAVPQSPADLDGDGQVGGADLGLLLFGWGACPVATPPWATLLEALPDPAVVTDPSLRSAIAATGLAWRVRDTGTQIEMLLVPPGSFQMGCIMGSNQHGCSASELPVHQVTLTGAFYLGRYEVTQSQWETKMGTNPSYLQGQSDSASRPVEQVSWTTIQGFCSATGMRLPTEAEWEYACRAGTQTPFYNGSTDDSTVSTLAWWVENSQGETHPVGGKSPNGLGFHDMLGNVRECVNDWFGPYPAGSQTDPTGPPRGQDGMFPSSTSRGGSYADGTGLVGVSGRGSGLPFFGASHDGFRVARNP